MDLHVLLFIYVYSLNYWCFRPAYATPKVLEKAGLKMSDISVFEFHEAFAVSEQTHCILFVVESFSFSFIEYFNPFH